MPLRNKTLLFSGAILVGLIAILLLASNLILGSGTAEGQRYLLAALVFAGLIFGLANRAVLNGLIWSRLNRLSAEIRRIGESGDLTSRLATTGGDELARLAERINGMLGAVERSQQQRLEGEQRYRAMVQETAEGIFLLDTETKHILEANAAFQNLVGYTAQELMGLTLYDLVAHDRASIDENVKRLLAEKRQSFGERKYRRKSGSLVEAEISASLFAYGGKQVACVVVRDVTQRKWAEDALRRNEAYFRSLIDSSLDVTGILNADGTVCYLSPAVERMLGFKPERLMGRNAFDMICPDDATKVRDVFSGGIQNPGFTASVEFRLQHQDGSWVSVETSARSLLDNPAVMGIVFSMRDITARKRAEQRLRESEERYRQAVENSPNAIFSVNREGMIQTWNRACENVFKHGQEFVGRELSELLLEHGDKPRVARMLEQVFHKQALSDVEMSFRCQDGTARFMTSRLYPLLDASGEVEACVFANTDITGRKRAEAETEQRANEFAALLETSRDLAVPQDLPTLLHTIVERAAKLLLADCGGMYLYDQARGDLVVTVATHPAIPLGIRLQFGEGMAGRVAQTRQPLIVEDYRTWEHRAPQYDGLPITAVVQVPMLCGGELIGVLAVHEVGDTTRKFTEADARLLSLFAAQAASAVHNAHLLQQTSARAEQLALLYDAGLALNSVLEPHAQLEFLFELAMKTLHAGHAEFFRFDPARAELRFELGVGYPEEAQTAVRNLVFPLGAERGVVGQVAQERTPEYLPDVFADPRWIVVDPGIRSLLSVPVEHENRLLGVLSVLSDHADAFSPQDERLLVLFANQAAVALENARLFTETEHRLQRLHALGDIDKAISSSLDLRVILEVVLDQVTTQLRVDAADILLHNPRTQRLSYASSRGFRSRALQYAELRLGEGLAGMAAMERRIVHFPDLAQAADGLRRSPLLANEGFVAYFAVPLIAKGHTKGVLEIFHRAPLEPDQEWLDFAQALASQAAIAIDDAES